MGKKEGITMKKSMGLCLVVIGFAFLTFNIQPIMGAGEYPSKPIQMLVAYRAGGTTDTMARMLAKPVGDILGQPVVVVNKPGGGGGVAATALKNSEPDGYTLCMSTAITFTFNPHVGKFEYTLDDFEFIAAVAKFQEAFVSTPDKPWRDFEGLVDHAKTHPGLTWASMAPIDKVFLGYIGKKEGIEWRPVPTKGGAGVVAAVLGKHVDFGFSGGIHYSYAKAGKMIVLATPRPERLADFPDVPTLKDLGYDVEMSNFNTVAAPKGTPPSVVKKLADAFSEAVKDSNYVDLLENKIHFPPFFLGPVELEKTIRSDSESYRKMIQYVKE